MLSKWDHPTVQTVMRFIVFIHTIPKIILFSRFFWVMIMYVLINLSDTIDIVDTIFCNKNNDLPYSFFSTFLGWIRCISVLQEVGG